MLNIKENATASRRHGIHEQIFEVDFEIRPANFNFRAASRSPHTDFAEIDLSSKYQSENGRLHKQKLGGYFHGSSEMLIFLGQF